MEQKDMTEWTDMLDMSREAEKVQQLLQSRDYPAIRRALLPLPPASVADILQELPEPQSAVVFRFLPKGDAAMAFSYLPKAEQKALIHSFTDTEVLGLVEQMHVDDSVDFLEELPANVVNRILRLSAPETRNLLNRYMEMPEGSAGSIMTAEFITLDGGLSASRAIAQMRGGKRRAAAGHMVYITGEGRKLEGILSLYDLLMAKEETVLRDLLDKAPVTVHTDTPEEEVLDLFRHHALSVMAVVDKENRIVGVITADDILDLADREASEDAELMAAMHPMEDGYLETSVWQHAKNRLPWLLFLLLSGILNGVILGGFEATFMLFPILITFIPMLTDTGGNAGSQSSTLVIRGLAMGDLSLRDAWHVLRKELAVSVLVGVGVALATFLRAYTMEGGGLGVALTVSLGLLFIVIMSKLLGGILPILAKKVGMDPALMAAPLVTTVVDALGLIVYFSVAKVFLNL